MRVAIFKGCGGQFLFGLLNYKRGCLIGNSASQHACSGASQLFQRFMTEILRAYYKDQTMLVLLPLIVAAMAQECPYCRWNSCTLTPGSLASCSDCYLGALVNFQLIDTYLDKPVNIGICMVCPRVCVSCQYAVINQTHSPPLVALNCTECISQRVVSYYNGTCVPCPGQCTTCVCGPDNCSTTICTECADGYTLNASQNRCVANQGRLLFVFDAAEGEVTAAGILFDLRQWVLIVSVLGVFFLGFMMSKIVRRRKRVTEQPRESRGEMEATPETSR